MAPACGRTTDGTGDPAALGLRLFLAPRRRHAQFEVPYDGAASLVHVVQSLGIPLTEVGAATIDGVRSVPSVSPRPGAVIELEPPSRPQKLPHGAGFLLDVGLGTLARRLRLLGVTTTVTAGPARLNRSNGSLGGPVASSPRRPTSSTTAAFPRTGPTRRACLACTPGPWARSATVRSGSVCRAW
jgi:hypothetical protein